MSDGIVIFTHIDAHSRPKVSIENIKSSLRTYMLFGDVDDNLKNAKYTFENAQFITRGTTYREIPFVMEIQGKDGRVMVRTPRIHSYESEMEPDEYERIKDMVSGNCNIDGKGFFKDFNLNIFYKSLNKARQEDYLLPDNEEGYYTEQIAKDNACLGI